jgi:hypothetical protein
MNIRIVVRAITLMIALALTVIAINLQAYVAPPVLSAETLTVMGHAGGDQEAYPIAIPLNWQLCPC